MKAARLYQQGSPMRIEEITGPLLPSGGVKVRVQSTHVLSFTRKLLSGQIPVPLPTPYTPGAGAIGIVEEVAGDVAGLQEGTRVFCSPYLTSGVNGAANESILIGWFGCTPGCAGLLSTWKNGSFAEQAVFPAQCVTPIEEGLKIDSQHLAGLNYLAIAYGGWLRGGLASGQKVLISGATGNLGTAAVLTALAIGAAQIVILGRDKPILEQLMKLDPSRIMAVSLGEDPEQYQEQIGREIGGVDLFLDALGNVMTPEITSACINALRPGGTAVLIGGVFANIPVSYYQILAKEITIRGSFMYPASAPSDLLRMVKAGTLNINAIRPQTYKLDEVQQAIERAALLKGLEYCVILP